MKIYIAHSKNYDYENELYLPIRNDKELKNYNIILPHEKDYKGNCNREFYNDLDLFIAEASYKGTGLGIELGWAYDSNVPIYIIHKSDCHSSNSLKILTNNFYEYSSSQELVDIIKKIIKNNL